MKKILVVFILLISGLATFSQKQTEKEVRSLLCHKWKLDHVAAGDQRLPTPPGIDNTFLELKSNGTVIAGDPGKQKKGKWSYNHKTKSLTTETGDKNIKHAIIRITKTQLVLQTVIEGIILNTVMKRND